VKAEMFVTQITGIEIPKNNNQKKIVTEDKL